VPTAANALCIVASFGAEACGPGLSAASPITESIVDPDGAGGVAPLVYGAALDGVDSVSLTISGQRQMIPVKNNVFVFQAQPTPLIRS
jgi:hypothetical protein